MYAHIKQHMKQNVNVSQPMQYSISCISCCCTTATNVPGIVTLISAIMPYTSNNLPEYEANLFGIEMDFTFSIVLCSNVHLCAYIYLYSVLCVFVYISASLISLTHETFFSVHLFTCLKFNLDFTWRRANVLILCCCCCYCFLSHFIISILLSGSFNELWRMCYFVCVCMW